MPSLTARLPRSFYRRECTQVARALLGQRLVRILPDGTRLAGIIVETEAYLGVRDKGSHTFGGRRTPRNASMWGDGGHAYIYFTYGMHHCLNVVTGHVGDAAAVLIRALEPTEGLVSMIARRQGSIDPRQLCSGPARLCQALALSRAEDGLDLVKGKELFLERLRLRAFPERAIVRCPRIGIPYAEEWSEAPLRFYLRDSPFVSRRARGHATPVPPVRK